MIGLTHINNQTGGCSLNFDAQNYGEIVSENSVKCLSLFPPFSIKIFFQNSAYRNSETKLNTIVISHVGLVCLRNSTAQSHAATLSRKLNEVALHKIAR